MNRLTCAIAFALFVSPFSAAASSPVVRVRCVTEETVIYQPFFLSYEVVQTGEPDGDLTGYLTIQGQDTVFPHVDLNTVMQSELLKNPSAIQLMDLLGIDPVLVSRCDVFKTAMRKNVKVEVFAFIDATGNELKKIGIFGDNIAICSE